MKNKFFTNKNYGMIVAILLIIVVAWYVSKYHYQLMLIQGDSMSPAFHNRQLVVLKKKPEVFYYGDIIAFQCDNLNALLVKRIVAIPGDTVLIEDGTLFVNGEESKVFDRNTCFTYAGIAKQDIVLQQRQYFVIGDNISDSKDSRFEEIGVVSENDIIGKVISK